MLDPFYNVLFYNKNQKMASLSDISLGNILIRSKYSVPKNYLIMSILKEYLELIELKKFIKLSIK
jgi:hypothetical protein